MAMDQELIVGLLGFTHYILKLLSEYSEEAALVTVMAGGEEATYLDPIPILEREIANESFLQDEEVDAFVTRLGQEQRLPTPVSSVTNGSGPMAPSVAEKQRIAHALARFFDRFFRAHGTFEIDHVELVGRFDMALELWQLGRHRLHGMAPLLGFDADVPAFMIEEGLSIRAFTPLSREYYAPAGWAPAWGGPDRFRSCAYYLRYELDDETLEVEGELPEGARICVSALKLLRGGLVGTLFHAWERWEEVAFQRRESLGGRHHVTGSAAVAGGSYRLKSEDIPAVRELMGALREIEHSPKRALKTGLRRFMMSYHRFRPEDRLLDLSLVAEAVAPEEFDDLLRARRDLLSSDQPLEDLIGGLGGLDDVEELLRRRLRTALGV